MTGTFEKLAILSTLAIAPLYMSVCAAAVKLRRGNVAILGKPLTITGLPAIALFGVLSMIVLICLAKRDQQIGLAGALLGSVALFYTMRAIRRPAKG